MNVAVSILVCSYIAALKWTEKPAVSGDRVLTFGRGAGTLWDAGTSLWSAHAMTAECHQPPDDSSLA